METGNENRLPKGANILRVKIKMCAINLVKAPQQVLGGPVDVAASRVVGEVAAERRPGQLLLKQVDFIEEKNDTSAHKPS